jgi:hypothetical protein
MLPAPKITTSSTRSPARPATRHHARADAGEDDRAGPADPAGRTGDEDALALMGHARAP